MAMKANTIIQSNNTSIVQDGNDQIITDGDGMSDGEYRHTSAAQSRQNISIKSGGTSIVIKNGKVKVNGKKLSYNKATGEWIPKKHKHKDKDKGIDLNAYRSKGFDEYGQVAVGEPPTPTPVKSKLKVEAELKAKNLKVDYATTKLAIKQRVSRGLSNGAWIMIMIIITIVGIMGIGLTVVSHSRVMAYVTLFLIVGGIFAGALYFYSRSRNSK